MSAAAPYRVAQLDADGHELRHTFADADPLAPGRLHGRALAPVVLLRAGETSKDDRRTLRDLARALFPARGVVVLPVGVARVEVVGVRAPVRGYRAVYDVRLLPGRERTIRLPDPAPGERGTPGLELLVEYVAINPWRPDLVIAHRLEDLTGEPDEERKTDGADIARVARRFAEGVRVAFGLPYGVTVAAARWDVRFAEAVPVRDRATAEAAPQRRVERPTGARKGRRL